MSDTPLEQRMKSRIADWHDEEAYEDWRSYQREYAEAADEIASLRARVEALEGALEQYASGYTDTGACARQALKDTPVE